jgi:lipopolysaccharide transport system permease protein
MLRNIRELYQYRVLLLSLTQRELKARYRASVLGFFWTFLNPTLLMLAYTLVFAVFMKAQMQHYVFFLFVGLLPWVFFSTSLSSGASAISDRRDLLTKVRFPAQVLPATVVATNLVNYLLSLPLMFILGASLGEWPTWHSVVFPAILVLQILFTLALSYMISALNVAFRDLQHIVGNLVTLWFFVTPVLYPTSTIPDAFRKVLVLSNPMAILITSYQAIFYYHQLPRIYPLALVTAVSLALLWVSALIFERRREEFAELV